MSGKDCLGLGLSDAVPVDLLVVVYLVILFQNHHKEKYICVVGLGCTEWGHCNSTDD